jgi:hypothetical protein
VPGPSAAALIDAIGSKVKQHLHLPGGHVGAVVSKHAAKTLWPQLEAFYAAHDAPQEAPVAQVVALKTAETPSAPKTKPLPPRAPTKAAPPIKKGPGKSSPRVAR